LGFLAGIVLSRALSWGKAGMYSGVSTSLQIPRLRQNVEPHAEGGDPLSSVLASSKYGQEQASYHPSNLLCLSPLLNLPYPNLRVIPSNRHPFISSSLPLLETYHHSVLRNSGTSNEKSHSTCTGIMEHQQQPPQQPGGGVMGPTGRRLHIAHRRSPSELTPLMSMFSSPGSK
jgi:hypothetical protein